VGECLEILDMVRSKEITLFSQCFFTKLFRFVCFSQSRLVHMPTKGYD
jgi:hypothetical protein